MQLYLVAVVLLLVCGITQVQCQNSSCSSCACCKGGICDDEDACEYGCADGHYGNTCWFDCPTTCVSCTSGSSCSSCEVGYYNGRYRDHSSYTYEQNCRHACRSECKQCSSYYKCSECEPGHYGSYCQRDCLTNCKVCTALTTCSKCDPGFYGSYCQYGCPTNCKLCTSADSCTECHLGFHGDRCQNNCPRPCSACSSETECYSCKAGFHGSVCQHNCKSGCHKCIDSDTCTECNSGYYGDLCQYPCPLNCKNNLCDERGQCLQCGDGYYGTTCDTLCPDNCKPGSKCEKSNGYCLAECVDGRTGSNCGSQCSSVCQSCTKWNNLQCTKCSDGNYGYYNSMGYYHCSYTCPGNCYNNSCHGSSGECLHGCKRGYSGSYCNINCPPTCSSCITDGQCESCNEGYTNTWKKCQCRSDVCTTASCEQCRNITWYPDASSQFCCQCGDKCKDNVCISDSSCSDGCREGFYGRGCDKLCSTNDPQCFACESENEIYTKCTECKTGYYPSDGDNRCESCPIYCLNGRCDRRNGRCLGGCHDRFWGEKCENICQSECIACDRNNGTCTQCATGKYGIHCNLYCSVNCKITNDDVVCAVADGKCMDGCSLKTVVGPMCDKTCSSNCSNNECDWISSECTLGCVLDTYGPVCEHACEKTCADGVTTQRRCFENNGTCVAGCLPGYYGEMCDRRCSENCKNNTCEMSSGTCHHGCMGGFMGGTCQQAITSDDDDGNGAVIGGSVAGVVVFLAIAAGLVVVFVWWKRKGSKTDHDNVDDANHIEMTADKDVMYINTSEIDTLKAHIYDEIQSETGTSTSKQEHDNINMMEVLAPKHLDVTKTKQTTNKDSSATVEESKEQHDVISSHIRKKEHTPLRAAVVPDQSATSNIDREDNHKSDTATFRRKIHVNELAKYVASKQTADFEDEFREFPHGLRQGRSFADSQKPENMARNRYRYIYPYDEFRVKLTGPGSDYINASYIDGFHRQNAYIACLGPTEKATEEFSTFWNMVWQQNVEKIVMVTNLCENGANKCDQYWPDAGINKKYGEVSVTCHSVDVYADYTVRSFTVSASSLERAIFHIHFTAWPDKGVPDDVTSIIEFRQKVSSTQTTGKGPIIVHCSAGVGRTGTYIALDALTQEGETDKAVDIAGFVIKMREHRLNMVQIVEQYEYLHNALVHSLTFDSRAIPGDQFQDYVASMDDESISKMFKQLENTCEIKSPGEIKAVEDNKLLTFANRSGSNIPGNRQRPRLHLNKEPGSPDYINAVYVDSFKKRDRYIVAQTPLTGTVRDFISLVYQENCTCIISMDSTATFGDENIGTYFLTNEEIFTVGDFTISSANEQLNSHYSLRKLTICHSDGTNEQTARKVNHIQFTKWEPSQHVPESPNSMLQLIQDVEKMTETVDGDGPIIVHCLTGGRRSGLFCVTSVLLQKMEIEHEVSVVNTIRKVKSRRRNAIPTKEQFLFCYQCVAAYLQTFDIYSNFSLKR